VFFFGALLFCVLTELVGLSRSMVFSSKMTPCFVCTQDIRRFQFTGGKNVTLRGSTDPSWGWIDGKGQAVGHLSFDISPNSDPILQWWGAVQQVNRPHGMAFNHVTGGVIRDMKIWKASQGFSHEFRIKHELPFVFIWEGKQCILSCRQVLACYFNVFICLKYRWLIGTSPPGFTVWRQFRPYLSAFKGRTAVIDCYGCTANFSCSTVRRTGPVCLVALRLYQGGSHENCKCKRKYSFHDLTVFMRRQCRIYSVSRYVFAIFL